MTLCISDVFRQIPIINKTLISGCIQTSFYRGSSLECRLGVCYFVSGPEMAVIPNSTLPVFRAWLEGAVNGLSLGAYWHNQYQ